MPKYKRNIVILLAVIAAGLCVWGLMKLRRPEVKNIDSRGRNIVCFGDSITFGYGAGTGEDFPSLLAKMLNEPVINAGVDGDTTVEAAKRFEADAIRKDPLLVIIALGGNDFLGQIPKETTLKNIGQMIDEAQRQGAMVAIADISVGMFLRDYRIALSRLAREKQAIFIPSILGGIITNPSMKSDFLHPNAAGYRIIAQRIYQAIIPYLNRNSFLRQAEK
jgi:lysophospholipase L1-like esterase